LKFEKKTKMFNSLPLVVAVLFSTHHHRAGAEEDTPALFDQENHCRDDLDTENGYFCPVLRYCPYSHYSADEKAVIDDLFGQTEAEWDTNQVTGTVLEAWWDLDKDTRKQFKELGYDRPKYECCLNHYQGYYWSNFNVTSEYYGYGLNQVQEALEALGHDETTWNGGVDVPNALLSWEDLSDEVEEEMKENLCYSQQTWDQVDMDEWGDSLTAYPGEYLCDEVVDDYYTCPNVTVTDTEEEECCRSGSSGFFGEILGFLNLP
jgi:hypothetical protein